VDACTFPHAKIIAIHTKENLFPNKRRAEPCDD